MDKNREKKIFLKACMAEALIQLLKTKKIEKITTAQIATVAGVSRATWFRNFSSKQEAVTYMLILSWEKWAEEHDLQEKHDFSMGNVHTFFEFNKSIRDILTIVYAADLYSCVFDAFIQVMRKNHQKSSDKAACYRSAYHIHALFGVLNEWILRDFRENVDEMETIFHDIVYSTIN